MTGAGATRRHPVVTAAAARRTVLLLTATRWFPVGLTIGVTTLLTLQRGMSVAQLGVILSMQGFVVLGLELPTGGLADAVAVFAFPAEVLGDDIPTTGAALPFPLRDALRERLLPDDPADLWTTGLTTEAAATWWRTHGRPPNVV